MGQLNKNYYVGIQENVFLLNTINIKIKAVLDIAGIPHNKADLIPSTDTSAFYKSAHSMLNLL